MYTRYALKSCRGALAPKHLAGSTNFRGIAREILRD